VVVVHDQLVRTELDDRTSFRAATIASRNRSNRAHQLVVADVGSGEDKQAPQAGETGE
jgi:hypothetical protein